MSDFAIVKELPDMKPGDKLLTLLKKANVSQSKVGRMLGKAPTSVKRYVEQLNEDALPNDKWMALSAVLLELGIEAQEIKPLPIIVSRPSAHASALVSLLDLFKPDQLEALLKILNAHPAQVEILKAVAEDRVKRR